MSQLVTKLNPKELVVLALINETPAHAYKLEEKIEQRGMRNWTDIGFSSIYRVITGLEKKGLVRSEITQEDSGGRIQKRYSITKKGQGELKEAVKEAIATPTRGKSNFDVGLANIWLLTKNEAIEALEEYLKAIKERRRVMHENWEKSGGRGKIPFLIEALFEHGEVMSLAEMKFVEDLKRKVERYGISSAIAKE